MSSAATQKLKTNKVTTELTTPCIIRVGTVLELLDYI